MDYFSKSIWFICLTLAINVLAGEKITAQEEKITGSAAFRIDGNDVVRGVVVGVSVGKNSSFSEAFYDPNTGQLSTVSIGSAGTITLGDQSSVGIGSIQDSLDPNPQIPSQNGSSVEEIPIGPTSGTDRFPR